MFHRPKPKKEVVALERIVIDPALQHRATADGLTYHEAHVLRLVEAHENGEPFDPVELVSVPNRDPKREPTLLLFDGFNRHECYRRREVAGVEAWVYPGTRQDAELWSLSSNSRHGLNRSADDCRKAFTALMDSPALLAAVIERGRGNGGTQRAIAAACGLAKGIIGRYLADRGLQADKLTGKLIPLGTESPELVARKELVGELAAQGKKPTTIANDLGISKTAVDSTLKALKAEAGGKAETEGGEQEVIHRGLPDRDSDAPSRPRGQKPAGRSAPKPAPTDTAAAAVREYLGDAQSHLRRLDRVVGELLNSKAAGDKLREVLKRHGFPLEARTVERQPVGAKIPVHEQVEHWPLVAKLSAMFAELSAELYLAGAAAGR